MNPQKNLSKKGLHALRGWEGTTRGIQTERCRLSRDHQPNQFLKPPSPCWRLSSLSFLPQLPLLWYFSQPGTSRFLFFLQNLLTLLSSEQARQSALCARLQKLWDFFTCQTRSHRSNLQKKGPCCSTLARLCPPCKPRTWPQLPGSNCYLEVLCTSRNLVYPENFVGSSCSTVPRLCPACKPRTWPRLPGSNSCTSRNLQ